MAERIWVTSSMALTLPASHAGINDRPAGDPRAGGVACDLHVLLGSAVDSGRGSSGNHRFAKTNPPLLQPAPGSTVTFTSATAGGGTGFPFPPGLEAFQFVQGGREYVVEVPLVLGDPLVPAG